MDSPYTIHTYRGIKILHYARRTPLTLPGWYVKGFFRCPTFHEAMKFIDEYEHHTDTFCAAAKKVLRIRQLS